jgi:5'-deoxynucleotidase YfbR-like HD superfamily hydrolase
MNESYDILIDDSSVIRTVNGNWVNVFEPDPDYFDIEDIAHALSNLCRFGGQIKKYYSVAAHSIWCCHEAEKRGMNKKMQLTALMHDSSEAYLVDMPRPIKKRLKEYKEIEDNLMSELSKKYNFYWPMPIEIKEIDSYALQVEWDYLMVEKPDAKQINVYSIEDTANYFLYTYNKLIK